MKVLFLYTELAGYIRNCLERLASSGAEVHVVAYPVNKEAPFVFDQDTKARYYDRFDLSTEELKELTKTFDPQAIFCSGWVDDGYIEVMRSVPLDINRVLISDNALTGNLRDHASSFRAKSKFKSLFDFAFVSGEPQRAYAKKMGFAQNQIFKGFYTADDVRFLSLKTANDSGEFPKRLVYAGRYVEFKGVRDLWRAFVDSSLDGWELHCIGTGDLWDERIEHPSIIHHGFLQPDELAEIMKNGGVFVLPSHKEPWGVVVHEFAAAGFPLLLSDKVNSRSAFLKNDENGFTFKSRSVKDLKSKLLQVGAMHSDQLREMSARSRQMAEQMTVSRWLKTVEVITNRRK
jgi:glycosyltransferase involved in cell wall biosynthesis